jgi:2,4-didehydro-3-deoxy-L-rhamnonate hydrolase
MSATTRQKELRIMRKLAFGTLSVDGGSRAMVIVEGRAVPLQELLPHGPADVTGVVSAWPTLRERLESLAYDLDLSGFPQAAELKWLAPLQPGKVLCVGSNYWDHVAEMAGPAGVATGESPFPYSFLKPRNALVGSGQEVAYPSYGERLDWEAELGVVIGEPGAATGTEPLDAVFGYTIVNDLSLRDFIPFPHALGLDALVSKGFDGAAPVGPWITPAEYVRDPQNLGVELKIDGQTMQSSSTAKMIFGVRELVAHYARVLTLESGDLIATGTPAGVGAARKPPRYLRPGEEIEASVEGLGVLRTRITERHGEFAKLQAPVVGRVMPDLEPNR